METIDNLYLDTDRKFETISELLEFIIPEGNAFFVKETFYDKDCTESQCDAGRRSFGDLYMLFKTYFPGISEKESLLALENHNMNWYICGSIEKIVFHKISGLLATLGRYKHFAELGKDIDDYYSNFTGYTLKDFIKILEEN